MDFSNSWYVIERNNRLEIKSHEDFIALSPSSCQMFQNYPSRSGAMSEMRRLVQNEIKAASAKIQQMETRLSKSY
jgi:hypothetical protein